MKETVLLLSLKLFKITNLFSILFGHSKGSGHLRFSVISLYCQSCQLRTPAVHEENVRYNQVSAMLNFQVIFIGHKFREIYVFWTILRNLISTKIIAKLLIPKIHEI